MPYDSYLNLLQHCKRSPFFKRWLPNNIHCFNKKEPTPIALLLLCALRYLGRAWTTDDLFEQTTINRETIREYIHAFRKFGSTTLYKRYVAEPMTAQELKDCAIEFLDAGLPGTIGSTDATHIVIEQCPFRLRQLHLGYRPYSQNL